MINKPASAPLALSGIWTDPQWGTTVMVDNKVWVDKYPDSDPEFVSISHYDNKAGFLVGQNGASNSYAAGMWTRVDWVKDTDDTYWYCKTHFESPSEDAAMKEHPA